MTWHTTEALGSVREVAGEPRTIEGTAVPYGVVSGETEFGREAFAPAAFAASVDHWMSRKDGARMAFRPAHKEKPVGTVTMLEDTPVGVSFRASIFDGAAGDEYLGLVRAGLNGVSIEAGLEKSPKRMRDGTVLHREAKLHAIAGSISPAYDGARIANRDMEDTMSENETPKAPDPQPEPPPPTPPSPPTTSGERDAASRAVEPIAPALRSALERDDDTVQAIARSQIRAIRTEAVYGRFSGHSFLGDVVHAREGDGAAAERMSRHYAHLTDISLQIERAGDVLSTEIPGAYPNDYLPGLLTTRILKGRPMGGFYQRIPITDARPKIFPKITTSTTVAVQSAEGVNPVASDLATTAVTVTPLLYGAETVVSRQVLDGGDPSAEQMIISDMMEAYAQASETVIKTAVEAGSTASGAAIALATPYAGLIANINAYYLARFAPPDAQFIPSALLSVALAQADSAGRSLLSSVGSQNATGVQGRGMTSSILGTDLQLAWAATANVVVTGRPSDFVIFESSVARFRYEAATGPAAVRLGIWAYLVVGTRLGSLKVTAA